MDLFWNLNILFCLLVVWFWHPRGRCFPPEVWGRSVSFPKVDAAKMYSCGQNLQSCGGVCHQMYGREICQPSHHQLRVHLWPKYTSVPHCVYIEPWFWPCQWLDEAGRENWVWVQQTEVPFHGSRSGEAGPAVLGDGHCPWSVANVTELSLVGQMAARTWEGARKTYQTPSWLQTLADHRTHWQLPYWYSAEVTQGTFQQNLIIVLSTDIKL